MESEDEELKRIRESKRERLVNHLEGGNEPVKQKTLPDSPVEVTDADFDTFVNKFSPVVIDCWAPWCGPCQMVGPIIEELAKEYSGRVVFGKLNVDSNQNTARKYGIMSIPTLLVFKDSKLVGQQVGAMPKDALAGALTIS